MKGFIFLISLAVYIRISALIMHGVIDIKAAAKFDPLFEILDVHDLVPFLTERRCGEEIASRQAPVSCLYVRSRFLRFLYL